jgi:prepilin-type N-terminal cleavage/methylation domain-containing protein
MEPGETAITMRRSSHNQAGFTFIEVMVALIILASASGILVGMQSSAIARTIRDKNAQQGMLLARRIMTSIEMLGPQGLVGNFDGEPALNALQKWAIPDPTDDAEKRALAPFYVSMTSDDLVLPLPNISQDPMKKVTLRVYWGPEVDESFVVVYLMAM